MPYVQAFPLAVPEDRKEDYRKMAEEFWPYFQKHGAISTTECWEDAVEDGQHTSFPMAVKRRPAEKVVFSWILWPDRESYEKAFAAMMQDPELEGVEMPFDGERMMWGGFEPIFAA
ncbi:DUF1428 domain-containing protein [Roseobacter sp. HKCCA0434]|uniref:DUF1428 domain-containing protein n=1 Tax=Roseobacter sp. HKCCA0434 TaxID=3079297 RepID=UPI002905953B|nr:DUF1428 domain-containing protein [Roseobacter sp. HKCCA0434]